jgi:hypothetical protein
MMNGHALQMCNYCYSLDSDSNSAPSKPLQPTKLIFSFVSEGVLFSSLVFERHIE